MTPCLSCLFPEKPEWDQRGFSVLGAVSGTLACLTALEAIKLITGFSQPLLSQLLTIDLNRMEFAKRRSHRDRSCPVCGLLNAVLTAIALVQYAAIVRLGDTRNPIRWNPQSIVISHWSLVNNKGQMTTLHLKSEQLIATNQEN